MKYTRGKTISDCQAVIPLAQLDLQKFISANETYKPAETHLQIVYSSVLRHSNITA
jgi:hypothetical protein